jgi:peptidoglycan/xylan/chitin deacetylase (PgdA/CDA1 family)
VADIRLRRAPWRAVVGIVLGVLLARQATCSTGSSTIPSSSRSATTRTATATSATSRPSRSRASCTGRRPRSGPTAARIHGRSSAPPYGGCDADVLVSLSGSGYRYTVLWEVDTIDWRPIVNDPAGPTADQIVAKVLGSAQSGSIVLMHLGGYETYAALPRIVAGLQALDFGLVTLDGMFRQ